MNRRRHQGFGWIECAVVLATLLILAAVLFPVFARMKDSEGHRSPCQSNLKQIGLGFLQYTQDYDDLFPRAALSNTPALNANTVDVRPAYGWADALYPYVKSHQLFQCFDEPNDGQDDPTQLNYTDYWMNGNLSAFSAGKLTNPTSTLLSGDGNGGHDATSARYAIYGLSTLWIYDLNSPAYRHLGTMNLLFADGHVKAMKPQQIVPSPTRGPSFSTR